MQHRTDVPAGPQVMWLDGFPNQKSGAQLRMAEIVATDAKDKATKGSGYESPAGVAGAVSVDHLTSANLLEIKCLAPPNSVSHSQGESLTPSFPSILRWYFLSLMDNPQR